MMEIGEALKVVGICTEIIAEDGQECGGYIVGNYVARKNVLSAFLFGTLKLDGYVCEKCGLKTSVRNIEDQIRSLTR